MWSGQKDFLRFGMPNFYSPCLAELPREVSVSHIRGQTICESAGFVCAEQGERLPCRSKRLWKIEPAAPAGAGRAPQRQSCSLGSAGILCGPGDGCACGYVGGSPVRKVEEHRFKAILRKMGFSRAQLERDASCSQHQNGEKCLAPVYANRRISIFG